MEQITVLKKNQGNKNLYGTTAFLMLTAPAGVVGPASIASYAVVFTQSLKNGARASSIGARAVFSGRARMFHVSEDSGGDVSEDSGRNTGVQASELFENFEDSACGLRGTDARANRVFI
jgi:hypothetical protein